MVDLGYAPRGARRSRSDALARSPRGERRGFQIGPRIRIGGTLGKIGQSVKEGIGKLAHNPLVDLGLSLIPGVGPLATGLIAAGGRALDTSKGGVGMGDILKSGVEGFGAAKAGGLLKDGLGTAVKLGDANGGGVMNAIKNAISGGGADGKGSFGVIGDLAGKAPEAIDKVMGTATGGKTGGSTLDKLLLAASMADQAAARQRQQKLQDRALQYATSAYDAKDPLRTAALGRITDAMGQDIATPDFLSGSPNPYQRPGFMPGSPSGSQGMTERPTLGSAVPINPQRSGYMLGAV